MNQSLTYILRALLKLSGSNNTPRLISKLIGSIVKKIVKHGPLRKSGFTFSLYEVWLADQWDDATFRFCASASYGFFYSDWIRGLGDVAFIDVGANQGIFSLIASKNSKIKHIYSFEPQPKIFDNLTRNIQINGANNVRAFPYAISNKEEEIELQVIQGHSGAATLRKDSVSPQKFLQSVTIRTVDRNFLERNITPPPHKKIAIKIDTEGHEREVIDELMKCSFWTQVFNIFYEVDERYIKNNDILEILARHGFTVTHQNGTSPHYDLMLERA